MKFRKKPVVIEATQWFKNGDHPDDGPENREGDVVGFYRAPEINGMSKCKHCGKQMQDHGWIDTLEGGHVVCPGDWVITGVVGERYPCKPDVFDATYSPEEPVSELPKRPLSGCCLP